MTSSKPFRNIRLRALIFALLVFLMASAGAYWVARALSQWVEQETLRIAELSVPVRDIGWAELSADGTIVTISGRAPDQTARFRAAAAISRELNLNNVRNEIEAPTAADAAPSAHLEIVISPQYASIIGIVPRDPSPAPVYEALERANPVIEVVNLVEDTMAPASENWAAQLSFVAEIVDKLDRAKIVIEENSVTINSIAEDATQSAALREDLLASAPAGLTIELNITAPRALIAPFGFHLAKDDGVLSLHQCAATRQSDISKFVAFADELRAEFEDCALGIGAPVDNWGDVVAEIAGKVVDQERFDLKIQDRVVTAGLSDQIPIEARDAIASSIRAGLPPGFDLEQTVLMTERTMEDLIADGGAVTLVFKQPDYGKIAIEGPLSSEASVENLRGYAIAKFGTDNVTINADILDDLPRSWDRNAFSTLQVVSAMPGGEAVLAPNQLIIKGIADSPEIRDGYLKVLEAETMDIALQDQIEIAQGAQVVASNIEPTVCVERLNEILNESPIYFEKGVAKIADGSNITIVRLAQVLYECNQYSFEIGGHTDSSGSADVNLELSNRRAEAVYDELRAMAMDFGEIRFQGYGSKEPIASNDTEQGRAKNRRIEIRLAEQGEQ